MALLIDGYNLLNVTDIFAAAGTGTELHRSRMALLDFLAAAIGPRERSQTTIVFDAAGAPPGLPSVLTHAGMTVRFARRHADADELIELLLDEWKAPKSLTVVSSDHRVQRAARQHGARYVDSERWFAELRAEQRERADDGEDAQRKTSGLAPPDEVEYWINEFAKKGRGKKRRRQ